MAISPGWSGAGGDFAWERFETEVDSARDRWQFLSEAQARWLVAADGLKVEAIRRCPKRSPISAPPSGRN
jgi:glycerol-3-phosphate dehydrogenase